ncbi:MAG: dockerin type I domain-containing protein, partial [Planctomycetota bacterium]
TVDFHRITVSEAATDTEPAKFGFLEVAVFPDIDAIIQGTGSVSGTINTGIKRRDLDAATVSVQSTSPRSTPVVFDVSGTIELDDILEGEFLEPGRELVVKVETDQENELPFAMRTITRVFNPPRRANLESIPIQVSENNLQQSPVALSFTLPNGVRSRANFSTEGFRMIVDFGDGNRLVLLRDAETRAGELEIEGDAENVVIYNVNSGLVDSQLQSHSRLSPSYTNFGTFHVSVAELGAFGTTPVNINNVLPTVVARPELEALPTGDLKVDAVIDSQNGVRIDVVTPDATGSIDVPAGSHVIDENISGLDVQAGQTVTVRVTESEPNAPSEEIEIEVVKQKVTPQFVVAQRDDGSASSQFDFTALESILDAQLEQDGSASVEFVLDKGDGTAPIEFRVTRQRLRSDSTVTFDQTSFIVDGQVSITSSLEGEIAIAFDGTGTFNMTLSGDCVEGSFTATISEPTANIVNASAILQPNGSARVFGNLPVGVPAGTLTIGGTDVELPIAAGQGSFAFDPFFGVQVGDSVDILFNGISEFRTEVEEKATAPINLTPRFVRNIEGPEGSFFVEFDPSDLDKIFDHLADEMDRTGKTTASLKLRTISVGGFLARDMEFVAERDDNGSITRSFFQSFIVPGAGATRQVEESRIPFSLLDGEIMTAVMSDLSGCFVAQFSASFRDGELITATTPATIFGNEGETVSVPVFVGFETPTGGDPQEVEIEVSAIGEGNLIDAEGNPITSPFTASVTLENGGSLGLDIGFQLPPGDAPGGGGNGGGGNGGGGNGGGGIRIGIPRKPGDPDDDFAITDHIFTDIIPVPDPCEDHPLFPTEIAFDGDVSANLVGNNLEITGDALNNGVVVFADDRGLVVHGLGGTKVNGLNAPIVLIAGVNEIPGDLVVTSMGLGSDLVCVSGVNVAGSSDINSTPGDDTILMSNVFIAGDSTIDVGEDDDLVDMIDVTIGGASLILAGAGDDIINASDSDDVIRGSDGIDTLRGGLGNDTLIGGVGADDQFGGPGDDVFVWNNGDGPDNNLGGDEIDTLKFNGADGAADTVEVVPGADDGDFGANTASGPSVDLRRFLPTEFVIETVGIESFDVNLLGGNDTFDATQVTPNAPPRLSVTGGAGDDSFSAFQPDASTFDGGNGFDELTFSAPTVDLSFPALVDEAFKDLDAFNFAASSSTSVSLSPDEVRRVVGDDADLTIGANPDDDLDLGDGWQRASSENVDDVFQQVFVNEGTRIRVTGVNPFQNTVEPADVNGDNRVSALDALLVINALRRARSFQIQLPDERDDLDSGLADLFFLDVDGDGLITAIDALRVINQLSQGRSARSEPAEASEPPLADADADSRKRSGASSELKSAMKPSGLF